MLQCIHHTVSKSGEVCGVSTSQPTGGYTMQRRHSKALHPFEFLLDPSSLKLLLHVQVLLFAFLKQNSVVVAVECKQEAMKCSKISEWSCPSLSCHCVTHHHVTV